MKEKDGKTYFCKENFIYDAVSANKFIPEGNKWCH